MLRPLLPVFVCAVALCGCASRPADAAPQKPTVRVQITYLTVTGPAQFAPPDFNPHFDDPRQALRAFQYQAKRQQMTVSTTLGPTATVTDGITGQASTGTAVGSAIGRTAGGQVIDDHIASFQEHHLSATPHRSGGTIQVEITLTDRAYSADDRTHKHTHDQTPRVIHRTLTFHSGDTLLLSTPAPGTAGPDYVFATVTLASTAKARQKDGAAHWAAPSQFP